MPSFFTLLIDLLYPPTPEQQLLRESTSKDIAPLYKPGTFKGTVFLSSYRYPLIKAAIVENKFHHNEQAANMLASLLEKHPFLKDQKTAFIPIPLGKKRMRERGHNQVLTVLERARLTNRTFTNILKRTTETDPQSRLNKIERKQNIQNAFYCTGETTVLKEFNTIIIVDDVVTTGATLQAAKKALQPCLPPNVSLEFLALAH